MPTRSSYPKNGPIKIIYQRLRNGSLVVDFKTGEVYSVKPPGYYRKLIPFECDCGYLFVAIYKRVKHRDGTFTDFRRGIAVHKLVWIAFHKRAVPRGYEVHHKNRNKKKNGIKNLRCLSRSKHRELHAKEDEALNYFAALAETGTF